MGNKLDKLPTNMMRTILSYTSDIEVRRYAADEKSNNAVRIEALYRVMKLLNLNKKISWSSTWENIEADLFDIIRNSFPTDAVILLDFLAECGDPDKRDFRQQALNSYRSLLRHLEPHVAESIDAARSFNSTYFETRSNEVNTYPRDEITIFLNNIIQGGEGFIKFSDNAFYDGAMRVKLSQQTTSNEFLSDVPFMQAINDFREYCFRPINVEELTNDEKLFYHRKLCVFQDILIGIGPRIDFYQESLEALLIKAQDATNTTQQRDEFLKLLNGLLESGITMYPDLWQKEWFTSTVYQYALISDQPPGWDNDTGHRNKYYGQFAESETLLKRLVAEYYSSGEFQQCLAKWSQKEKYLSRWINYYEAFASHCNLVRDFVIPGLMNTYDKYKTGQLSQRYEAAEIPGRILQLISLMPSSEYSEEWFKKIIERIVVTDKNRNDFYSNIALTKILSKLPSEYFHYEPYGRIIKGLVNVLSLSAAEVKKYPFYTLLITIIERPDIDFIFSSLTINKNKVFADIQISLQKLPNRDAYLSISLSDCHELFTIMTENMNKKSQTKIENQPIATESEANTSQSNAIRNSEPDNIEDIMQAQFITEHKKLTNKPKFFTLFFKSSVEYNWSLGEILDHALSQNDRIRQACINLGWLNSLGQIADSSPDVIKRNALGRGGYNPT